MLKLLMQIWCHLFFLLCRCLPVPRGEVHTKKRHWLLYDSAVYPQCTHCNPFMGCLLDFYRCYSCPCHNWTADCAHHDHTKHWCALAATAGVIHQSHRRMDVSVSYICVCITFGVCGSECIFKKRGAANTEKQLPKKVANETGGRYSPWTGMLGYVHH